MMTPEQMQNRKPAEKEEKAAKPDYALQSGKTELAPKVEKAQKAVPPKQAEKAALTERAKRSAPAESAPKPEHVCKIEKTELAPKVEKAQKALPPEQVEKAALTERAKRSAPAESVPKPEHVCKTEKTELAPKAEKAKKAVPPKQAEKAALTERAKRSAPAEKAASSTKKGKMYEEQVAAYIKALGYQIREQNFRCFYGEIDLIAQKGKDLFLIEVKGQRQDYQAELKVNYAKRQRILNASAEYLRCCNLWQDYAVHYDVAVVTGNQVHYYADAFEW